MPVGVREMGRPKAGSKQDDKERLDRETVIHLKGSPEYVDWLDAAHKKTRLPKATIFRMGVELLAKQLGLPDPPEI